MEPFTLRKPLGRLPTIYVHGGLTRGSNKPAPYPPRDTSKMERATGSASPHAVAKLLPIIEEFEMETEFEAPHAAGGSPGAVAKKTKPPSPPKAKPKLQAHQRVGMAKLTPLKVAAKAPALLAPVAVKEKKPKAKPEKDEAKENERLREKEKKRLEKEKKEKAQQLFQERVRNKVVAMVHAARDKNLFFVAFNPIEVFKDKKFYVEHPEWNALAKGRGTWMVQRLEQEGYTVKIRKLAGSEFTGYDISGWPVAQDKK